MPAADSASQDFMGRLAAAISAEDWGKAERLLRRAAVKKGAPAQVFFNLGQVLVRSGQAEQAGHWYQRAAQADPSYVNAWCELGAWRAERSAHADALTAFQRALSLAPSDRDALRGAARSATKLCDWAVAAACWRALASDPEDAEAALGALRAALEMGDPAAAEMRARLAQSPALRPGLIKTITRTARGSAPLRATRL